MSLWRSLSLVLLSILVACETSVPNEPLATQPALPEAEPAPPPPPPPTASDPDELPEAAALRLGSARWRHPEVVRVVGHAAEGVLVTGGAAGVTVWDEVTGHRYGEIARPVDVLAATLAHTVIALGTSSDPAVDLWDVRRLERVGSIYLGHRGPTAMAFDPNGDRLVIASRDRSVRVVLVDQLAEQWRVEWSEVPVALALSPSGRLAIGGSGGLVALHDLTDGHEVAVQQAPVETLNALRFSTAGRYLAVAGDGPTRLALLDLDGEQAPMALDGHQGAVTSVVFDPELEILWSLGLDQTVRRWAYPSGEAQGPTLGPWDGGGRVRYVTRGPESLPHPNWSERPQLSLGPGADPMLVAGFGPGLRRLARRAATPDDVSGSRGAITALAVDSTGTLLIAGSEDDSVYLWDLETGALAHRFEGHLEPVIDVGFEDSRIVWSRTTRVERRWNVESGQLIGVRGDQLVGPELLSFDRQGRLVVASHGRVRVLDPRSGIEHRTLLTGPQRFLAAACRSDGITLALGAPEGEADRLYDVGAGRYLGSYPALGGRRALSLAHDGSRLAGLWTSHDVRIFDADSGDEVMRFEPRRRVQRLALSPDGAWLAGGSRGNLYLFEIATGNAREPDYGGHVHTLTWSADGSHVVAAGDRQVLVYDQAGHHVAHRLLGPAAAAAASSTGEWFAVLDGDADIELWQTGDEEATRLLESDEFVGDGRLDGNPTLVFSPDDSLLAALDQLNRLRVLEVPSLDEVLRLGGGELYRRAPAAPLVDEALGIEVRIEADGSLSVRDSDPAATELARFVGHGAPVSAVALGPEGRRLVTGATDGTILIWPIGPEIARSVAGPQGPPRDK